MRNRSAVLLAALAAVSGLLAACGGSQEASDEVSTGDPADALAFAAGSGQKLLDNETFRFELQDLGNQAEFKAQCNPGSDRTTGAMDLGRHLAFVDLQDGEEVDVVVSESTYYVRASALDGWDIPTEWLAVPMDDLENLNFVAIATGLQIAPTFWEGENSFNPSTALEAMHDTITDVSDEGSATVRGVETTRYELTIDPEKAGLWTGGTTTSTTPEGPPTTMTEDDLRELREQRLMMLFQGDDMPEMPSDVREAFLDGEIDPLVTFLEETTATTLEPGGRTMLEAMVSGDMEAVIDAAEETTGTTIEPDERAMLEALFDMSSADSPAEGLGALFNAFTSFEASAYVDDDGLLRRLDLRVDATGGDETTTSTAEEPAFWLDLSIEYWDIGEAVHFSEPDAADVTAVADLSPEDIPAELSPCYVRLSE